MKIRLNKIELTNFKGVRNFRADFNGKSALIIGKNGLGKTTIIDGFAWLFDNSDSQKNASFSIFQRSKSGQTIDNQEAIVEAEIVADGRKIILKKIHRQKWTKKRGQAVAEFSGNTTDYFFDGVPVALKEYNSKLSEIIPLDIVRSLFDVHHFVSRLHPDQRRKILIDMAGNADIDIDPELSEMLMHRTMEEAKKVLNSEKRKINEALERIPTRIDELRKMQPETGETEEDLREKAAELESLIEKKKNEILAIKSGITISELRAQAAGLVPVVDPRLMQKEQELKSIDADIAMLQGSISVFESRLSEMHDKKDGYSAEWRLINAQKFKADSVCFACGQPLPDDKIADQKTEFNSKKAAELKELESKANHTINTIQDYQLRLSGYRDKLESGEKVRQAIQAAIESIKSDNVAKNATIEQQRADLEAKIKSLMDDIAPEIESLESSLSLLEREHGRIKEAILDHVQIAKIKIRIEQHQKTQVEISQQFDEIDKKLYLLSEYAQECSKRIEIKCNEHFSITRWALFERLQNGDDRPICEAMRDGVLFADLNTGSKINIGIDCILALQSMYNLEMPVFVDNAESVTDWIELPQQTIRLMAQANVEKLEVVNESTSPIPNNNTND